MALEGLPFDKVSFSVIGLDPQSPRVPILLCSSTHTCLLLFFLHTPSPRTPICSLPVQPWQGLCVCVLRRFVTPWTVACQASLSVGLSRQEYWSGLLFPSPGDLPDPGMEPMSPVCPALQVNSLPAEPLGKPPGRVCRISIFFLRTFIHLFLAVVGLLCCVWAFSSYDKWGLLFLVV